MTTCSICYNKFNDEDNDGDNEETAGSDLDISISLKCETLKCDSFGLFLSQNVGICSKEAMT